MANLEDGDRAEVLAVTGGEVFAGGVDGQGLRVAAEADTAGGIVARGARGGIEGDGVKDGGNRRGLGGSLIQKNGQTVLIGVGNRGNERAGDRNDLRGDGKKSRRGWVDLKCVQREIFVLRYLGRIGLEQVNELAGAFGNDERGGIAGRSGVRRSGDFGDGAGGRVEGVEGEAVRTGAE